MLEEIAPRDARAEAQHVLGPNARVLEPSPPAVTEPPWFADDPTGGEPIDYSSSARALALAFFEDRLAELAA
jgi:hypothetical protein